MLFAGRFSSSTGVIGIDFGSRGIKMVQVREKAGALHVVGAARLDVPLAAVQALAPRSDGVAAPQVTPSAPPPPPDHTIRHDDLAEQIRAAFVGGSFAGPRCIISLAREDVCLQSIRLPRMPDNELREAAMWEASQRFGFDRNAMQVEFIRTGATASGASTGAGAPAGESREEVILVAASHAAIAARVEPVLAAGLRPLAVDTGFSAIVRAFSRHVRRESDRGHVRAIVEVGESGSTVLILRGDQVAFCKPIAIGGRNFNQAVADHLRINPQQAAELREARIANAGDWGPEACGLSPEAGNDVARLKPQASSPQPQSDPSTDRAVYEAVRPLMGDLVKEVTLCLRYYGVTFRGHPPDHIIITGGDGLEPRLGEVTAHTCKVPVVFDDTNGSLATLIGQIRTSLNRTPGPAAAWTVALGLSRRGMKNRRQKPEVRSQKSEPGAGHLSDQRHQRGLTSDLRPLTSEASRSAAA